MRRNLGKVLAIALLLVACGPTRRDPDNGPDGGGGGDGGNGGGGNEDGCPDAAKLIYVVDKNNKLLQFNPLTKTFNDLGTLPCQPTQAAKPFSMAVARDATAWVVYDNGELFRVETKNNLTCTLSAWVSGTQGLDKFGMGFSTDVMGGQSDTLFISGGSGPVPGGSSKLTKLNLSTFQPTPVGTVAGWPELTGTGDAELWGFFPSHTDARIVKLDKATGAVGTMFREEDLNNTSSTMDPDGWAFAFHGGSFWVFLEKTGELYTSIYQFNASTGAQVGQSTDTNLNIVGAGVSTCAPVIL